MSCSSPMVGIPKIDGGYEIMSLDGFYARYQIVNAFGKVRNIEDFREFSSIDKYTKKVVKKKPIYIPCGHCLGCRLDYSREWANRCVMESMEYPKEQSWFLTLTYDDEHLPFFYDDSELPTLVKKDMQDFIKRFRDYWDRVYKQKVRFFYAGEYGGQTGRPHYHMLVFGCDIYDLTLYKVSNGNMLYNSGKLEELWANGYVVIAPLNWNTAAYTARYCMKKATTMSIPEFYENLGISKEYTQCSLKPGIAFDFLFNNMDEILEYDQIVLPAVNEKAKIVTPPRYFDKIVERYGDEKQLEKLSSNHQKRLDRSFDMIRERHRDLPDDDQYFRELLRKSENVDKTLKTFRQLVDYL